MQATIDDTEEPDMIVSELLISLRDELTSPTGAFAVVREWAMAPSSDTAPLRQLEQCCWRLVRHLDRDVLTARLHRGAYT